MARSRKQPLVIGIAGGSGSGKTYLAQRIMAELGPENAALLSMDQYFHTEVTDHAQSRSVNFDHPSHLGFRLLISHVRTLRQNRAVWVPDYNFQTMTQTDRARRIEPKPVIVVEGLFVLTEPIVSLCDLTCFLNVATDERLLGRILRDIQERGATIDDVIDRYQRFVRPSYRVFVEPTMQNADVVVDFTYRRAMFTQLMISLIQSYVDDGLDQQEFVRMLRTESYHASLHPDEGYMSMTADIFKLSKAYPDKSFVRDMSSAMTSPAASTLGRRKKS